MVTTTSKSCPVCLDRRSVPTGTYIMYPGFAGWVPDGKTKACPGCSSETSGIHGHPGNRPDP